MLSLRHSAKASGYTGDRSHQPEACKLVQWGGVPGSCQGGVSGGKQANADLDLGMWGTSVSHTHNRGYSFGSLPEATQLSFSMYVSGAA